MSSGKPEPAPDVGAILRGDAKASGPAQPRGQDEINDEVKRRLDDVERIAEDLAKGRSLQRELEGYIANLQKDDEDIRKNRKHISFAALVMSVTLYLVPIGAVICRPEWFAALESTVQMSFLVVFSTAATFLMSIILRGLYRSGRERHGEHVLPENLRQVTGMLRHDGGGGA